jgi:hypothetical protein
VPDFDDAEVDDLIRNGQTLQAIDAMRAKVGCTLAEAVEIHQLRAETLQDLPVRPAPAYVLETAQGRRIDPSAEVLRRVLVRLSSTQWFAILQRRDGWFVQVGAGTEAGTRPGWYALERQDGSLDDHYRTIVTDIEDVIAAFTGFAADDPNWTRRFAWQRHQL